MSAVVDGAHGGEGEGAQMAADEQRLGVGVADAADAARAVESRQVVLEARAEGGVLDGVDLALEPVALVDEDKPRPARAQMRVIVDAEEHVQHHVAFRCCPEETAHREPLCRRLALSWLV